MKIIALTITTILTLSSWGLLMGQDISQISVKNEGIQFFDGTWKDALALAAQENKPIFLDISTKGCSPCKKLKRETYTNESVQRYFTENFINVSTDLKDGKFRKIIRQLKPTSYPSLFFMNKNGGPIAYTAGFLTPAELLSIAAEGYKNISLKH